MLDVVGVDHQDGEAALQHIGDWLPELAGALHRHMRDAQTQQPVDQRQQAGRGSGKAADVACQGAICLHEAATDHDGLLVNIDPGTLGLENLQIHLGSGRS